MPSQSLHRWETDSQRALDQIELAHAAVGGNERGRRYATLHINHAYLVLVSSHFQRFCRDLHTEVIDHICRQDPNPDSRRELLRLALSTNRQLETRNPTPGAIGSDFGRFSLQFWDAVKQQAPAFNQRRQTKLDDLNRWRNAIAHQDFAAAGLRPEGVTLPMVRRYRAACDHLAARFDVVLASHVATITGIRPW